MRQRLKTFLSLLLMIPWTLLLCQTENPPPGVLGKAGDLFITEREFLERFELLPALQRSRAGRIEEAKLELLYSIIAERLLSQEARRRGLGRDSGFVSSFERIKRLLARDELYRQEVSGKVSVSESEIDEGTAQALRELLISFIYFDREDAAQFVRRQIKRSAEFATIQLDSSLGGVRDTATVIWGDADPAIEHAAYKLNQNEVSPVLKAGTGYYLLKIEGAKRSAAFSALAPSVLREKILSKLRERKERVRLNEFVESALRGKTGYARPQQLRALADALRSVFDQTRVEGMTPLTNELSERAQQRSSEVLLDTLAVAGSVAWSVRDVIQRLQETGFSVDSTYGGSIGRRLNNQLKVWVQQELLEQEALARRLDQAPGVTRQLEMWYENMLAQEMKSFVKRQVRISEAEVLARLRSVDSTVVIPRVSIRELRTASLDDIQNAMEELDRGETFEAVCGRWCADPTLRLRKGLTDPFAISERPPLGELAWRMVVGERNGPLQVDRDYILFELVSRDSLVLGAHSTKGESWEAAVKEMRRQKEKRLLDLFLAKSGETRGFTVFQERLLRLKTSPIPMMTFRLLGFGGRIPAVPFVDPLLDWLEIEPPSGQILF